MIIYNTLSSKKESLQIKKNKPLKLFVCGPTVYDLSHIGHARTYIFFDAFVKYLRSRGFKVFYLENVTDIDDRIIVRAKTKNRNPLALAKFFEKEYLKDMDKLGVNAVNRYARATDFIPQIVKQIKTLIKKRLAYEIPSDGYYFDISKFPNYGKLSKRTVAQAEDAISRIDENEKKKNRGDFCLWKFSKPGEPSWQTKLGRGRPGWHIEDTAITEKFFGPQYDIHGGAIDLKFPHHEAEIAQQESASGKKPFVKIWMHTGFLLVNGKKMSKSLNNFITIREFLKKYEANVLRLLALSYHYRSPINFSWETAEQIKIAIVRLREFLNKLEFISKKGGKSKNLKVEKKLKEAGRKIRKALEEDFNSPAALARIFGIMSEFQNKIWNLNASEATVLKNFIEEKLSIFGVEIKKTKIPTKISLFAAKRELLRINKQFIQADALRKKIRVLGYEVEDTPIGPFISKSYGN